MRREVILYITASIDGFIADPNGGVEWLGGDEGADFGFDELMDSVDTVLQGSHTYLDTLEIAGAADPYHGKTNYVFTSRDDLPSRPGVTFIAQDAVQFVSELKQQPGEHIWLIGGGELASALVGARLVDTIDLFVQPVILGDGIALWRPPFPGSGWTLVWAREVGGLAHLRYRCA